MRAKVNINHVEPYHDSIKIETVIGQKYTSIIHEIEVFKNGKNIAFHFIDDEDENSVLYFDIKKKHAKFLAEAILKILQP